MFKSIKYVWLENIQNLYRIYCIAKYELLADMRDSKFGLFWNFASPAIQVLTYWLIFGIAWNRKPIGGIDYLPWLVVGYAAWWFIQPCIPVSYTHLDVYKRQAQNLRQHIIQKHLP